MKYFRIFILLSSFLIFYSCGTIKEGFTNQKKNSSDEFLVEKKDPLVMPPDYNELPTPVTQDGQIKGDDSIKDLLIEKDSENLNSNQDLKANKDLEDSLLEKIKKN
tara:strand:- start:112 stop:429 length:318 start_codon:yes stop_codon:yes gene_type:complete